MSEELGAISSAKKVACKKQVSMESLADIKEIKPSQEMLQLQEMKLQIDHAFSLMQEIRTSLTKAYKELE